jgi:hypothetical protein
VCAETQLASPLGWTLHSRCGGLLDCLQLECDLVGHELEAWESGHRVTQGLVGVMGDDESFNWFVYGAESSAAASCISTEIGLS